MHDSEYLLPSRSIVSLNDHKLLISQTLQFTIRNKFLMLLLQRKGKGKVISITGLCGPEGA